MAVFNESPQDAKGRPLREGDEVILNLPSPIYFRVAQVTPVLDPTAPRGTYHVHLGTMFSFTLKGGAVTPAIIRVRTVEEAGPSNLRLLDAKPLGSLDS